MRGIVHTDVPPSMIVDVVDLDGIVALQAKHHAPVAADVHRPGAFQSTPERMQAQTRQVHVARLDRRIEPRKDESKPVAVCRLNATRASGFKECAQSLVAPSSDYDRA